MITGLSGMGLNELVGAFVRARQRGPGSRGIQPMPGLDTVQFSRRGRELAAATAPGRSRSAESFVAERPVGTANPVEAAGKASLMDRMKAAFFTQAGDDGFDATLDLNADGRINGADLAVLRQPETAPDPKKVLQRMRSSLFTQAGDDRFDARLDLNTDGAINFADLALLRARLETAVTRPPAEPSAPEKPAVAAPAAELKPTMQQPQVDDQTAATPSVESIRSAFFTSAGDDAFDAAADLNGDGRINFADLAELDT